jgi:hypothetical protein
MQCALNANATRIAGGGYLGLRAATLAPRVGLRPVAQLKHQGAWPVRRCE